MILEKADGYVLVHNTNMDYFSVAGTDNENICTMFATFVNQSAQLDTELILGIPLPMQASIHLMGLQQISPGLKDT